MKELKYVIKGDPRTKKNHQTIAGSGSKCPVCHKPQKQWIRQGEAHDDYTERAGWQLRPRPMRPIDFPINVRCLFFLAADRIVDDLNLLACVDDLLVENKIIADDNRRIVQGHDGTRSFIDRENPRTEIYITRMPVQETGQMTLFEGKGQNNHGNRS